MNRCFVLFGGISKMIVQVYPLEWGQGWASCHTAWTARLDGLVYYCKNMRLQVWIVAGSWPCCISTGLLWGSWASWKFCSNMDWFAKLWHHLISPSNVSLNTTIRIILHVYPLYFVHGTLYIIYCTLYIVHAAMHIVEKYYIFLSWAVMYCNSLFSAFPIVLDMWERSALALPPVYWNHVLLIVLKTKSKIHNFNCHNLSKKLSFLLIDVWWF